ncbi:hypothetical protein AB6M49_003110 [Stenotrophomonas maltophilia]
MITFDESTSIVTVVISVRGGRPGDLNRYRVSGMLKTLDGIAREEQGPVRRKLIDCLVREARALKRDESDMRAAKQAHKGVA